jgi:hypothetical protein
VATPSRRALRRRHHPNRGQRRRARPAYVAGTYELVLTGSLGKGAVNTNNCDGEEEAFEPLRIALGIMYGLRGVVSRSAHGPSRDSPWRNSIRR